MPELSVVISSLNGGPGVDRCLHALARQTIADDIEIVVVDDGSTDNTSEVARAHGVGLVRHDKNRGLSAARNSGIEEATAPIVAFLDDDCDPASDWAEQLLALYDDEVIGVGGVVVPVAGNGVMGRYLESHNPLEPLELELAESESLPYRLRLYLRRQWDGDGPSGVRAVHSLVGANMSFPRQALHQVGMFDTRFTFGAEELDLCRRLTLIHPDKRLVLQPAARVVHHFEPSLRDTLRRSRSYGRGSARMWNKWPSSSPTVFPFPFFSAGLLGLGLKWRVALVAALLLPHAMFPAGLKRFIAKRDPGALLDPYIQIGQEAAGNAGLASGLWEFRHIEAHSKDVEAAAALQEVA
jgi:GT2 family glycosyltransferase